MTALKRDQSCIVFDVLKSGTYIEAAINFGKFTKMKKMWPKYSKKNKTNKITIMQWLPHPYQLEKPSTLDEELMKFLNWLNYPSSKENGLREDPKPISLDGISLAYISNKRTSFQVNRTLVNLKHG